MSIPVSRIKQYANVSHSDARLRIGKEFIHPELRHSDQSLVGAMHESLMDVIGQETLVLYVLMYAADPPSAWALVIPPRSKKDEDYFNYDLDDVISHPSFECLKHGDVICREELGEQYRNDGIVLWSTSSGIVSLDYENEDVPGGGGEGDYGVVPQSFDSGELGSSNFYSEAMQYNPYAWFSSYGFDKTISEKRKDGSVLVTLSLNEEIKWWMLFTCDYLNEIGLEEDQYVVQDTHWLHTFTPKDGIPLLQVPPNRLLIVVV